MRSLTFFSTKSLQSGHKRGYYIDIRSPANLKKNFHASRKAVKWHKSPTPRHIPLR